MPKVRQSDTDQEPLKKWTEHFTLSHFLNSQLRGGLERTTGPQDHLIELVLNLKNTTTKIFKIQI